METISNISTVPFSLERICIVKKASCGFVVVFAAVTLLSAGAARAEQDGTRFRGGIALDGGALITPNVTMEGIGLQGDLGVQINNAIGVYAVPGFDVLFGSAAGLNLKFAVLADYTFAGDALTIGIGPDFGAFVAIGSSAAAGGSQYGGRLHLAWDAVVSSGTERARRKALVIAVDARFLVGPSASVSVNGSSASESSSGFTFSPTLSIGYEAF